MGSLRAIQVGGVLMMILGCLGKFGALFVTTPDPVIGGLFFIMFGDEGKRRVISVASCLPYIKKLDIKCSRYLRDFVILLLPHIEWEKYVDLSSSRNIFVLGTPFSFGLSLPFWINNNQGRIDTGTDEERGIKKWREMTSVTGGETKRSTVYDIPLIQPLLDKLSCWRYFPMCPAFNGCQRRRQDDHVIDKANSYSNEGFTVEEDRESTYL